MSLAAFLLYCCFLFYGAAYTCTALPDTAFCR